MVKKKPKKVKKKKLKGNKFNEKPLKIKGTFEQALKKIARLANKD